MWIFLIIIVLLIPFNFISIRFLLTNEDLRVNLYLLNYIKVYSINLEKILEKRKKDPKEKRNKKRRKANIELILDTLSVIKVERFYVYSKVGLSDEYNTSILMGVLYSVNGVLFTVLNYFKHVSDFKLEIVPSLKEELTLKVDIILNISVIHIIYVIVKNYRQVKLVNKTA